MIKRKQMQCNPVLLCIVPCQRCNLGKNLLAGSQPHGAQLMFHKSLRKQQEPTFQS